MKESDFANLMEKIIKNEFPNEVTGYKLSGKQLIKEIYEGQEIRREQKNGNINFLEEAKLVVNFFSLIVSTYKAVKDFMDLKKKKEEDAKRMREVWKKLMMQEGISEESATHISEKYTDEFLKSA